MKIRQVLGKVLKFERRLMCRLGAHEYRTLKGKAALEIYRLATEYQFKPMDRWIIATPIYCIHCNKIEDYYDEMILKALARNGHWINVQQIINGNLQ